MNSTVPTPAVATHLPPSNATGVARGRILVVDDEPVVVRAVSQILARAGFEVFTASGPKMAEEQFNSIQGKLSLLLTDVVMPEGGGRQLALRLLERSPELPILFMSGFTGQEILGGDDEELPGPLLTKPFTAAKLEETVSNLLK